MCARVINSKNVLTIQSMNINWLVYLLWSYNELMYMNKYVEALHTYIWTSMRAGPLLFCNKCSSSATLNVCVNQKWYFNWYTHNIIWHTYVMFHVLVYCYTYIKLFQIVNIVINIECMFIYLTCSCIIQHDLNMLHNCMVTIMFISICLHNFYIRFVIAST